MLEGAIVPLNPRPLEDEWFGSWLSRIAHANTMSLSTLLSYVCGDPHNISLQPENLVGMAAMFRVSLATIVKTLNTPLPLGANITAYRINYQLAGHSWIQICPLCLKNDLIPHVRVDWMSRRAMNCRIHNILLINKCPDCSQILIPMGNFDNFMLTVMTWDHPICFCQTCGCDLRNAQATVSKYIRVKYVGLKKLQSDEEEMWLNALYLIFENCRLDLYIELISFRVLRAPLRKPPLHQYSAHEITAFFNLFLNDLMLNGGSLVSTEKLRQLGDSLQDLANTTTMSVRAWGMLPWLASLLQYADETFLALDFPAVVFIIVYGLEAFDRSFYYTIVSKDWLKIKKDMELHGYPSGKYDRMALQQLQKEVSKNGAQRIKRPENAQRLFENGAFVAYMAAIYRLHERDNGKYNMRATWFTRNILNYMRKNDMAIFQSSLCYLSKWYRLYGDDREERYVSRDHLRNIALSLGLHGLDATDMYIHQRLFYPTEDFL